MEPNDKIILGLERISEVFKTLLWEKAKIHGISPIQIQLLLFISQHKVELCTVSQLSKEFNLTKPTISDAIRVLTQKQLVEKEFSPADNRSFNIRLSKNGKDLIKELTTYSRPLEQELNKMGKTQRDQLYSALTHLIHQLNVSGILQVQRHCFGCRYYTLQNQNHFCQFLQKNLVETDLQLDCPDHQTKSIDDYGQ